MKRKPMGCITFTGILAFCLSCLLITGVWFWRGGEMFSPGVLNDQPGERTLGGVRTHAETGGNCAACHPSPWSGERMSARCLDCHSDLYSDALDFHAVMLTQGRVGACYDCHPDHRGAHASLVSAELANFPHNAVGYSLRAHQQLADGSSFACSDCHVESLSQFDPEACISCHTRMDSNSMQAHLELFGVRCLACHDGIDSFGQDFDHNQVPFTLLGKHAILLCSDCHTQARTAEDLTNTPQACINCHAEDDTHQGGFGEDCANCHTSDGWEQASFDHNLAAFQLSGAHITVPCQDCHAQGIFKGTPQACIACHAVDDTHQGGFGSDCAGCHTTDGWEQASFDHSLASFPLTGAHLNVVCGDCHVEGIFTGTPTACRDCHAEPLYHQDLFDPACENCHSTQAWSPAQFDRPHTFPIDHGERGMSACQTCHDETLRTYTCYGCHEHNPAEIAEEHRDEGIRDFDDCTRCHPTGLEDEADFEDD